MYLLDGIILDLMTVGATTTAVTGNLFGIIETMSDAAISIVKWGALTYLVLAIAILGFKVVTEAKDGPAAIGLIKEKGLALFIGIFVVLGCFAIEGAMKSLVGSGTGGSSSSTGSVTHDGEKVVWS